MEIVSIDQNLSVQSDSSQYYIINNFYIVYEDKYFVISIRCYGNENKSILNNTETLNMKKGIYYGAYGIADRIKYLKQNYNDKPFINKNNVKIGKFVSYWPSGRTSDTYGLFFTIPNVDFNECSVIVNNIWSTFSLNEKLEWNDKDYKDKIKREKEN